MRHFLRWACGSDYLVLPRARCAASSPNYASIEGRFSLVTSANDGTDPIESVSPVFGSGEPDSGTLGEQLQALYDQVPSTCCANSGECCALTEEEMQEGWATMFPLYTAEYANIVDHIKTEFTQERRDELLAHQVERPQRCPFLAGDNRCTIYPVRPLICRTYAVMNPQTIEAAVEKHRGTLPDSWLKEFVARESGMLCPRVRVMDAGKLERHAYNLLTSAYERTLIRLSKTVELATGARAQLIRRLTVSVHWPVRWTWGGFNSIAQSPLEWVRDHFKGYWQRAELKEH
jgi:Fe-S-cluster containining protein